MTIIKVTAIQPCLSISRLSANLLAPAPCGLSLGPICEASRPSIASAILPGPVLLLSPLVGYPLIIKFTGFAPAAFALSVAAQETGSEKCQQTHVFLARGNNEPYPGRQGKLVEAICSGLSSCDYEDIEFYNPLPAPYCESVTEGARNGIQQITAYNKRCPDAKLVVSGYSQGGQVVGDILGGGGGTLFEDCQQESNEGLDADQTPGNAIVAALIFGDVRHTAGQPFNVEDGAESDGTFPRTGDQLANLENYGDVLRDYCVAGDPICGGGDAVDDHLNYFDVFTNEVASWVQERVEEDSSLTTGSQTTSTTSTTSSSDGSMAVSTRSRELTKTVSSDSSEPATATGSGTSFNTEETARSTVEGTETSESPSATETGDSLASELRATGHAAWLVCMALIFYNSL